MTNRPTEKDLANRIQLALDDYYGTSVPYVVTYVVDNHAYLIDNMDEKQSVIDLLKQAAAAMEHQQTLVTTYEPTMN